MAWGRESRSSTRHSAIANRQSDHAQCMPLGLGSRMRMPLRKSAAWGEFPKGTLDNAVAEGTLVGNGLIGTAESSTAPRGPSGLDDRGMPVHARAWSRRAAASWPASPAADIRRKGVWMAQGTGNGSDGLRSSLDISGMKARERIRIRSSGCSVGEMRLRNDFTVPRFRAGKCMRAEQEKSCPKQQVPPRSWSRRHGDHNVPLDSSFRTP